MYFAMLACIRQGIRVLFFDWEGSTDPDRAERIGIPLDWAEQLKRKEPVLFRYFDRMRTGQQMFRLARRIMNQLPDREEGPVQLAFFCDSLPNVVPEQQDENDETGANALRARLFSENLPLIKSQLAAKRCIWIDVNQMRTKPGFSLGNPEYEPCGEAAKTQSDIRIKAKKTIADKEAKKVRKLMYAKESKYIEVEQTWDGRGVDKYNQMTFYVTKNKAFSPNRGTTLRLWFEEAGEPGRGIDPVFDCFEYLRLTGQVHLRKKMMTIDIPPFNQEREVHIPVWDEKKKDWKHDPETGEIEVEVQKRDTWTWMDFKQLILDPDSTKGAERKKFDIIAACRKQLEDESAWALYFEEQRRTAMKAVRGSDDED